MALSYCKTLARGSWKIKKDSILKSSKDQNSFRYESEQLQHRRDVITTLESSITEMEKQKYVITYKSERSEQTPILVISGFKTKSMLIIRIWVNLSEPKMPERCDVDFWEPNMQYMHARTLEIQHLMRYWTACITGD